MLRLATTRGRLISMLFELSLNTYSSVRTDAQAALGTAISRYPAARTQLALQAIDALYTDRQEPSSAPIAAATSAAAAPMQTGDGMHSDAAAVGEVGRREGHTSEVTSACVCRAEERCEGRVEGEQWGRSCQSSAVFTKQGERRTREHAQFDKKRCP